MRQNFDARFAQIGWFAEHQFGRAAEAPLTYSELSSGIGSIRFQDSLGESETIAAFDRALAQFREVRALIIDLRNTPGGGNTSVARGVLGRFVNREVPYQKHSLPSEERETGVHRSWLELVSPRGPSVFERPVAVLVDHWTGSMGEGLAIGFDATGGATVVGTPMAGLLGATDHLQLPNTGIGVNVPAERLYHVNGTPREAYQPAVAVDVTAAAPGVDPFIAAALRSLGNEGGRGARPPSDGRGAAMRSNVERPRIVVSLFGIFSTAREARGLRASDAPGSGRDAGREVPHE
jgi:carboxyl-terminal processing protease